VIATFNCNALRMRLSTAGCARLWRSAQTDRPHPWEGRAACRSCPIGARNAGEKASPVALYVDRLRSVCARCLRPAPRQIRGRWCVSCYNRQREADKGANAKGGRPRLCDQLGQVTLTVSDGTGEQIAEFNQVVSVAEVLAVVGRKATAPMRFGRSGARPHG
jgi:hypothetical protein